MSHQQLNDIFEQYTAVLYAAAKRMFDKRNPQYSDKVQDLVILAYEEFIRKGNEGNIMDLPLVIYYMKLRRQEVQIEMRGYSRTNKTDVFNKRNYYEGKLELHSINNPVFECGGDTYADIMRDGDRNEESLAFEIDLKEKVSHLSPKENTILEMKINGFTEEEIARSLAVQIHTVKNTLIRISSIITGISSTQLTFQF